MPENPINTTVAAETIVNAPATKTPFLKKFSTNHPTLSTCGQAAGIGFFSMLGMYGGMELIGWIDNTIKKGKERRAAKKAAKARVAAEMAKEVVKEEPNNE